MKQIDRLKKIMFKLQRLFILICFLLKCMDALTQDYRALHGSNYGGSLTVYNNPASIVHVPYKWDITPLAIHLKHATNMVVINNASLLSPSKNVTVTGTQGRKERWMLGNQDIRLLNARMAIGKASAIAFGASIRNYQSIKTASINWQDTMLNVRDFITANETYQPLHAAVNANSWAELYGTYAKTFVDDETGILNVGITVKVNRGLAGAFLAAKEVAFAPIHTNNAGGYWLSQASLTYGYSSNVDEFDNGGTAKEKRKRFLQKSWSSIGFSAGAEYIIPSSNNEGSYYDYDLKLGIAILDIGKNRFQYGANSVTASLIRPNISDTLLDESFGTLQNFDDLPDSIRNMTNEFSVLSGGFFYINQPARIAMHADKRMAENIYVNLAFNLPLGGLVAKEKRFSQELTLASITPRIENRQWGFYLPASLSTKMRFWMGGAIKAGPLLLGIHNWANLFAKNKMQNGGMYLALTFRPSGNKRVKGEDNNYGSGQNGGSRKSGKKYDCPTVR
ncbi:MAG: hypothetical protein RL115_362 [Bacteroidota bacterium]|jgi:hypothetical protein